MEGLLFTRQHTGVYIHPLIQLIFIEYPLCDRTGLGFHGTVWIKQCFCCPRTFQEEQRENRHLNMKQIRWWLRLQIRKWNKGPESDPVKHAVLMKPSRNTAEAQKHVQLIASLQQAGRSTLGIQVSKQEGVQWASKMWAVPGNVEEGSRK